MPLSLAAALAGVLCLAACSPTFNWRDVRADATGLKALLPCKPDPGSREVTVAGQPVSLHALSCDAGGATFALLFADIGDASRAGEVLGQWKTASLATLHATILQETPFRPPGALGLPESSQVAASGQRADGRKVRSQAAYFAQGHHVFQAVIYSEKLSPEVAETFFSSLRFE